MGHQKQTTEKTLTESSGMKVNLNIFVVTVFDCRHITLTILRFKLGQESAIIKHKLYQKACGLIIANKLELANKWR